MIAFAGRGRAGARPELPPGGGLSGRPSRFPLPLLRQSARGLGHSIDRYPGVHLARAAGVVLAALIAWQCATLYGVIVTPLDGPSERAVPPLQARSASLLTGFDPFFTAAAAGATAPIAATDLKLHGFRQDRRTGGGSAIISQAEGAQRSFGIGEEVASGIVLKQVASDHVVVSRHGRDERLAFQAFETSGSAGIPAERPVRSPYALAPAVPSAAQARPRPAAPRGPALPPRSVDFADPSTIPASLTSGPLVPDRR